MANVIFYSTKCPKCMVLEAKLKQKGVEYIENNDIEKMLNLGIKSAPVLCVDGVMLDFADAVAWANKQ